LARIRRDAHIAENKLSQAVFPLRKLTNGYAIYSIGADGVDNGGIEKGPFTLTNYDITVTVER
jgi:hypothetical protein